MIKIEVVYALPNKQKILTLRLPQGATVREAIEKSLTQFPIQDSRQADVTVGLFGKIVSMSRVLETGDRVEIYRPLIVDPRQARHARVAKSRKTFVSKAR